MTFFDRVAAATKLTPLLAPFVVRRICVNQGIVATELGPSDLRKMLPKLVEAVTQYLDPALVPAMRSELDALSRTSPDGKMTA